MFHAFIQNIYAEVMFNFMVNFSWRRVFFVIFICILLRWSLEQNFLYSDHHEYHYIIETIIDYSS